MNPVTDDILMHYGIKRRSGRYPWGSGEDPYQHGSRDFLGRVEELRSQNFTYTDEKGKTWTGDTAIAKSMGLSTTQFRTEIGIAKDERRMLVVARAKSLREDGLGPTEIGREMGLPESTVRSLLDEKSEARMKKSQETADFLKERLAEVAENRGMIDVGVGAERELNISKEKLDQALYLLEREGYKVYSGRFEQVTNRGQSTTQKVLCPPGTEHKEIYELDRVHSIKEYISRDGGETFEKKFHYPASMDSKRLKILLADEVGPDGLKGIDKDGLVEIRRGVPDLSLGESNYSQVRILVDGNKYIKGMAVYSDNMPDGVDVIFNTNKTSYDMALKKIKEDPDNPFGSAIKDVEQGGQYWYDPTTGNRVSASHPNAKLGLINKRADEGDWSEWKDTLPSQFLGKQSKYMAQKQLDLAKADKLAEYEEICSLTNPTIKKHLLNKFADGCDSAAVHLQAAALPGQKYHVIIPINSLKDTEVYAPNYENGTKLALIRYPHGGIFEIPILTVNNKNALGKEIIGPLSGDAVGITKKVADRLSGADFDGDTVMCIPTNDPQGKVRIKSKNNLEGLEGFDPIATYQFHDTKVDDDGTTHYYQNGREFKVMTKRTTQTQMGVISNLITDMTLADADEKELAAAVRHSMVVIDAEKHKLNWKQSERDNHIAELHTKYQGKATGGAATILSRSKGEYSVEKRKGAPKVNQKDKEWYDPSKPEGALIYKNDPDRFYPDRSFDKDTNTVTIRTTGGKKIVYDASDEQAADYYKPIKQVRDDGEVAFTNKDGTISYRVETRTQQSTKMAETDDAYSLVSPARHPMELIYADYANSMKTLANQARIEMVNTGKIKYDANAKKVYQKEVTDLNTKLNTALLNATREREAQRRANVEINAKKKANPNMDSSDLKKASQQALSKYRQDVGSIKRSDRSIKITDKEWEAIQAGAISENQLKKILDNTDIDSLRERATPRSTKTLSQTSVNRIKALSASNYSLEEIATKLGVSSSTVSKYLKGVN